MNVDHKPDGIHLTPDPEPGLTFVAATQQALAYMKATGIEEAWLAKVKIYNTSDPRDIVEKYQFRESAIEASF
jgi:hypothetical protein